MHLGCRVPRPHPALSRGSCPSALSRVFKGSWWCLEKEVPLPQPFSKALPCLCVWRAWNWSADDEGLSTPAPSALIPLLLAAFSCQLQLSGSSYQLLHHSSMSHSSCSTPLSRLLSCLARLVVPVPQGRPCRLAWSVALWWDI